MRHYAPRANHPHHLSHPCWAADIRGSRSASKCVRWGLRFQSPPSPEASRIEALRDLWTGAGLDAVETRDITVQRTFADFDDFWTISVSSPSARPTIAAMASNDIELLKARVRTRLPGDAEGRITYSARANAVKGRVP